MPRRTVSQIERSKFSVRLKEAMAEAGIDPKVSVLHREFCDASGGLTISVPTVRKWLYGEAIPTQPKIKIISEMLGISPDWLRFGNAKRDVTILSSEEKTFLQKFKLLSREEKKSLALLLRSITASR